MHRIEFSIMFLNYSCRGAFLISYGVRILCVALAAAVETDGSGAPEPPAQRSLDIKEVRPHAQ